MALVGADVLNAINGPKREPLLVVVGDNALNVVPSDFLRFESVVIEKSVHLDPALGVDGEFFLDGAVPEEVRERFRDLNFSFVRHGRRSEWRSEKMEREMRCEMRSEMRCGTG